MKNKVQLITYAAVSYTHLADRKRLPQPDHRGKPAHGRVPSTETVQRTLRLRVLHLPQTRPAQEPDVYKRQLAILIIVLLVRPQGIFGKQRSQERKR